MKKILVVEDELEVRDNIVEILHFEGFEALAAADGLSGLQLAREQLPDLIIADIMVPTLNGYKILQELRKDSTTAFIPLIFVTAKTARSDVRKGMALGANDYLTKPFSQHELLEAVRTQLNRQELIEKQRLRSLSHFLVEMQEAERRRVARELRDEMGQTLAALKITLDMSKQMSPDPSKVLLSEAEILVNELMLRVNTLSFELRPTVLDDLGLLPALLRYFDRYTAQTQVQVKCRHAGLRRRFRPEVESAAFRIVQKALDNVASCTNSREVIVLLWVDGNILNIQIEDQSGGSDLEVMLRTSAAASLSEMLERVSLLQGQLILESASDLGTRLIARLAVEDAAHPQDEKQADTDVRQDKGDQALDRSLPKALYATDNSPPTDTTSPAISIVLAESHNWLRKGLRTLLEAEAGFSVVGETGQSQNILGLVECVEPDALILDQSMPGVIGSNLIHQVMRCSPRTKVLILSMHTEEEYVLEALRTGAVGYALVKSSSDDLVQALREVAAGRYYLSPALSKHVLEIYFNSQFSEDKTLEFQEKLTSREQEILRLVAEGCTSSEIAVYLSISSRTVEAHRANIMRKLRVRNLAELLRYALQHGIVDDEL